MTSQEEPNWTDSEGITNDTESESWRKMADILQITFSNAFSSMKKLCILTQIFLKAASIQVMAWHQTDDKPLS